jgi:hypothetical protein
LAARCRFQGTIDNVEPYPDGVDEDLAAELVGIAASIPGITSIAADANGAALNEPIDLGYFPKWQN